ncbi:DUF6326 family protein [Flavobacterium sp. FlaQc-57]|uniref:DUF6326 family protein n=1 Tax=Flavobacterium sp. FlaQc-57 TaxID=3374186 RepID=UPI0037574A7A
MDTQTKTSNLKDFEVNIKIKLAFLWTAVTLCYLYGDYFELYVPEKTTGLLNGDNLLNSPMKLLSASILLAIPAVMVFLSIFLKPKFNRFLNILIGIFFTAIMVLIAFTSLTPWKSFYVFLALLESVITSLIVFYAWKWPKDL